MSGTVLGIVTISSTNVDSPRTRGRLHESLVARRSFTRVNDEWPTHPSVRSRAVIIDNGLGDDVQESSSDNGYLLVRTCENKPLDISYWTYISSLVKSNGSHSAPTGKTSQSLFNCHCLSSRGLMHAG